MDIKPNQGAVEGGQQFQQFSVEQFNPEELEKYAAKEKEIIQDVCKSMNWDPEKCRIIVAQTDALDEVFKVDNLPVILKEQGEEHVEDILKGDTSKGYVGVEYRQSESEKPQQYFPSEVQVMKGKNQLRREFDPKTGKIKTKIYHPDDVEIKVLSSEQYKTITNIMLSSLKVLSATLRSYQEKMESLNESRDLLLRGRVGISKGDIISQFGKEVMKAIEKENRRAEQKKKDRLNEIKEEEKARMKRDSINREKEEKEQKYELRKESYLQKDQQEYEVRKDRINEEDKDIA